jgi:hypothetical protein
MVRASPTGRRLARPLLQHSTFNRAVENIVTRFGLVFLKACAGNRCDRITLIVRWRKGEAA